MNRSSYLGVDQAFCALQGYAGAYLFNAVQNTTVINPAHAAIGLAGFSYLETVIRQLTKSLLNREKTFYGPIPTGKVTIVSYGLAACATFKAMELSGLIANVPTAAKIAGVLCAAVLILKGCAKLLQRGNQYTSRPQRAREYEPTNNWNDDFDERIRRSNEAVINLYR